METIPEVIGFGGLCVFLVGAQFWTIKRLFSLMKDRLERIERKIDNLPCQKEVCHANHPTA